MPKLILLRHGESTWNREGLFTGWTDVPLTEQGRAEAATAGHLIADADVLPDVVHTSVLQRDYPVALGILVLSSMLMLVGNILSDILYALVDPRIRFK